MLGSKPETGWSPSWCLCLAVFSCTMCVYYLSPLTTLVLQTLLLILMLCEFQCTAAGDSWTLTAKPGPVSCGAAAPFSWVLVHTRFCCALQESISQSCVSSGSSVVGLMATSSKRAYAILKSAAPRAPAPVAGHC